MTDESKRVAEHFDAISSVYYDMVDGYPEGLGYYHSREFSATREWLQETGAQVILDAGSGPGRHSLLMRAMNRDVVAFDLSRNMLVELRSKARGEGRAPGAVNGDLRALPFDSDRFDLAICMEVIEHLPQHPRDTGMTFAELGRVVRPGGYLILEFPLYLHSGLRKLPGSTVPFRDMAKPEWYQISRPPLKFQRRFWLSDIQRRLRRAGFSVMGRRYIRVLPSGFIRKLPALSKVDTILEEAPIVRLLAREVVILARKRLTIRREVKMRGDAGDDLE